MQANGTMHPQDQDRDQTQARDSRAHLDSLYEENEDPTVPEIPTPSTPTELHTADTPTPPEHPHHEHVHHYRGHRRRCRSVSHVDVDFFDRPGLNQLRRSLTEKSRRRQENKEAAEASRQADTTLLTLAEGPLDLENTARIIVAKSEEAGITRRQLGVLFRDLRVVGIGASASHLPTLGSVLNPFLMIERIQTARHPPLKDILSGFEGVVRPGEMLLVLGRPGSGCSTLLKSLANQRGEFHHVYGDVHYDSLSPAQVAKHYRGDVQYCPEDDVHFPTLTVAQTLHFAATTRTPQSRPAGTREEHAQFMTALSTTVLGLRHTLDTYVGNNAIRGVSGGEKKRVSIAEAMMMRSRLNAWDNSTRGLDSSTALEFGRALRIMTDIVKTTTIVSIYQASENLYQLFDKVCVIDEGRMAYFGPANRARQYFIDMGYGPADRQTTPDFLVAVTDAKGRIPRAGVTNQPRTPEEFAEYFRKSELGAINVEDMNSYDREYVGSSQRAEAYKESARLERAKTARKTSPYTISIPMQVRAVMVRRVQILMGNKTATIMNLATFVFQGIIVGTVFLNIPESTDAYFSRGGVLFFALLFSALTSLAELSALFQQRPIVSRHQKAALYHPFIEAVALTIVDLPITLLTTGIFSILLYFIVGLQTSAGQFFVFYLFLVIMALTMKAWFRAIAAAFKSQATAHSVSGIVLLGLVIYTGYTLPKSSMIGALRWITYINPLRYGFEVVLSNEFRTLNGRCANLVPQGPGYENISIDNQVCATVGAVAGQNTVNGNVFVALSYGYSYSHTWMNFGIILAFGIVFIIALLVFSEFNTALSTDTSVVLFKRGTEGASNIAKGDDEEKNKKSNGNTSGIAPSTTEESKRGFAKAEEMKHIFSWQNLSYTVPVKKEGTRKLLDDVSGYVAPGKLTALMGESGAGKTTLLNVLAKRISMGVVTGHEFVNGHPPPADFQAQTGYCQQLDTHVPTDTVREALLFSAKLRQPASVPLSEKEAYVETCIKMCGLSAVADASVGSLGIEHRKRTTIAVELAAKPKLLLFLDEPTSGLDSQSAWAIMAFLRDLADHGQAILCTIHQPSAELFQVFDRLLLLRKGGQTVYFGDVGQRAITLINYFERNGSRKCSDEENPAEFMLDVIGAGASATADQDWHAIWEKSPEAREVQKQIEDIHAEGRRKGAVEATVNAKFATSWMSQTKELLRRDLRNHWRDPTYLMAKFILNISAGLFIGFTFFKAKNSQQGTQNKLFAMFLGTILSAPLSNQLQSAFIAMRNVYEIRERPTRMYSWTALITSQVLAEIPWNIAGSATYFFCWYWTVGFPSDRAGYTFLMLVVIFPLYYTTFGQAIASMVPSPELGAILFSFLYSFVVTFCGVLQPYRLLGWWQWMYHLSPFTYYIEGILGQALGRSAIVCSEIEYVTVNPPAGQTCSQFFQQYISNAGGYLEFPDASSGCRFCAFASTDEFLFSGFNITYGHRWRNFGIMLAFIVFNFVSIYFLSYIFRIREGRGFGFGSLKARFARPRSAKSA
ncbi:hypothetical protein PC9H_007329 [Pleurotus ostreatus]|uniref:ABC transporter domain-containing protein n=1 Tax=Pleurotus ostreatus TaxID=5322 RepID=A0A8H6ZQW4_PLEOS|nr:uncharacterized protein PC9H_007329 [Pleurotus ostreatus]KAF7428110.1 hypothetical protein PC9H_007329 [Pleurotus ostreatus]KAJ8696169.1 ATP-binding cassette transporter snq2 [Pleurotus ostreatus]